MNLGQVQAREFIGVWLIPECIDVAVFFFREGDGPLTRATIWGKFDSVPSRRIGLYRLGYQLKATRNIRVEVVSP